MTDLKARRLAHARPVLGAVGWVGLALASGSLVLIAACGGDDVSGKGPNSAAAAQRPTVIEHEACNPSGSVKTLDANNNGKPDIQKVMDGSREVCRITDLNHNGKPDMYEYFDASSQLRRREFDYDDNGIIDAVELFQAGKLVERHLDTSNRGRIDTWDFFDAATGKRTKRERDATGDGRIDQWWLYEGDRVTIAMDRTGDGNPDPHATIVLDKNGAPIASVTAATGAPGGDGGAAPPPPAPPEAPSAPPPPPATADPSAGPSIDAGAPHKAGRPGGAKR